MLAPVDPRPYAGPTDLVTAADVLAWLEEMRTLMVGALPDVPLSAPAAVDVTIGGAKARVRWKAKPPTRTRGDT